MTNYKILDLSAKSLTVGGEWWDTTIILEHKPGFFARLFGKKSYIRTYFSKTSIIWTCLETHETLYNIFPGSIAGKLQGIHKMAPMHKKKIQEEQSRLAAEKAEAARIKEENILQARRNRSRFNNIEY